MKISLIIPAYNEEKYIGACLDAALKNSGDKFHEIIVIDNASTDRTKEIAESFPGVRAVHEPKKGLTQARQRGYTESTGDILAYIDADTRMLPGWVEQIKKEFAANPNLATLSGPYIYYDIPAFQNFLVSSWYVVTAAVYFFTGFIVTGGNFAIKRSILDKMKGFDTTIAFYGEDTNIARRAHAFGKVRFILKFKMPTSGRRLSKQGIFMTGLAYGINFFSEVLWHKPVTTTYTDIR